MIPWRFGEPHLPAVGADGCGGTALSGGKPRGVSSHVNIDMSVSYIILMKNLFRIVGASHYVFW